MPHLGDHGLGCGEKEVELGRENRRQGHKNSARRSKGVWGDGGLYSFA